MTPQEAQTRAEEALARAQAQRPEVDALVARLEALAPRTVKHLEALARRPTCHPYTLVPSYSENHSQLEVTR